MFFEKKESGLLVTAFPFTLLFYNLSFLINCKNLKEKGLFDESHEKGLHRAGLSVTCFLSRAGN